MQLAIPMLQSIGLFIIACSLVAFFIDSWLAAISTFATGVCLLAIHSIRQDQRKTMELIERNNQALSELQRNIDKVENANLHAEKREFTTAQLADYIAETDDL